jgi:transcriptional regulator with XRE-family HTH domain
MKSDEFRQARLKLGLTQEELARRLNFTTCAVNRWENTKRKVNELAVLRLQALLSKDGNIQLLNVDLSKAVEQLAMKYGIDEVIKAVNSLAEKLNI